MLLVNNKERIVAYEDDLQLQVTRRVNVEAALLRYAFLVIRSETRWLISSYLSFTRACRYSPSANSCDIGFQYNSIDITSLLTVNRSRECTYHNIPVINQSTSPHQFPSKLLSLLIIANATTPSVRGLAGYTVHRSNQYLNLPKGV
jgi:hypothetical protein